MARSTDPIAALVHHAESRGRSRYGRLAYSRWVAAEPGLAGWDDPAQLVRSVRSWSPPRQDPIVAALLSVFAGDELAQLSLLAVLGRAMGAVVAGWSRAGVQAGELGDLEAELVEGCWRAATGLAERVAAGGRLPARPAIWIVTHGREAVRAPRRTERRRRARHDSVNPAAGRADRPVCDALATEIARAVHRGLLSPGQARTIYLTRVAGYPVDEAAAVIGCSPGVLRAVRSRAERRLIETAA